jgi:hypothetical protein
MRTSTAWTTDATERRADYSRSVEVRHTDSADSAGAGEIVKAYTLAQVHGGTAKLMVPKNGSRNDRSFIAKVMPIFDTYDDEAQAMRSFGGDKA